MKHLAWAAVTIAAFAVGLLLGQSPLLPGLLPDQFVTREALQPPRAPARGAGAAEVAGPAEVAGFTEVAGPAEVAGFTEVAGPAAWAELLDDPAAALRRLDQLLRAGDTLTAAALRQRWFERVQADATAGRTAAARALLDAYFDYDPYDVEALLLDSDLRQMQGRGLAALDPLLALLQFSDDGDAVARARGKLALLVGVHETQLANRGDVSGLIRFFEDLTVRDPSHDGHRLRLARWLLQGGRAADAERVLAQTGVAGVDPQARADLLDDVRLARSGLPLEYGHNAMHVRASLSGRPLRLLVDTGATTTVISRDRAVALGASPTGERVLVRTAAGLVEAELHRVIEFEVGALRLDALTVLVLDQRLPDGVDGLLGMDVITRFGGGGRAGLPFSVESR